MADTKNYSTIEEDTPIIGQSSRRTVDIFQSKEHGYSLIRRCLTEFIGDLLFIFTGAMAATSGAGTLGAALIHGIAIFVLIAAMGGISGGHFNPAVTLGVMLCRGIPILEGVFYMIAQLLGGFVGALFVRAAIHGPVYLATVKGGVTVPAADVYPMEAIVCELLFTYLLVSTVLLTAIDTETNSMAPLAIGLSITVDILAGGGVSGASMNPARSFGPAIAFSIFGTGTAHWDMHYVYWVGPALGAACAAGTYMLFLGNAKRRLFFKH